MSDNNSNGNNNYGTVHPRDMWGTATREPAWKSIGGGILERLSTKSGQRNQIKRDENNVWKSVSKKESKASETPVSV